MTVTTDDGRLYEAQETQVTPDGRVITEVIHAPVDGKFHPVLGSPGKIEAAITRWTPGFMHMELRAPGGFRSTGTCRVSSDSNTITCDEIVTDSKGTNVSARSVYVRSP